MRFSEAPPKKPKTAPVIGATGIATGVITGSLPGHLGLAPDVLYLPSYYGYGVLRTGRHSIFKSVDTSLFFFSQFFHEVSVDNLIFIKMARSKWVVLRKVIHVTALYILPVSKNVQRLLNSQLLNFVVKERVYIPCTRNEKNTGA